MKRAAFAFVFITVMLDMLALGIVVPVGPALILQLSGSSMTDAAAVFGLFGTVWAAMQFVFAPVLGALSDRFGRRPVILISCLGLGLDYFVMALAPNLAWLFLGRILSGITASSFSTGFAYIADVTPPDQRAGRFGLLGVAFGVGFVLGPALGGLLGNVSLRLPFWVSGALSLAGFGYGLFVLPESLPAERRAAFSLARANPLGSLALLRSYRALLALAAAAFLYRMAHDALPSLFVLFGKYRFTWSERTVGLVLAGVGVASMVVQGGLIRPVVARFGERRALLAGFLFGAASFAIYALAPTGSLFVGGIPFGALLGLAYPSLQSLMSSKVAADEQGRLQGAIASLMGVAGVVAPLMFTQVFALSIGRYRGLGVPGAAFLLASVLLAAAAVISGIATRPAGEGRVGTVVPADAPPGAP